MAEVQGGADEKGSQKLHTRGLGLRVEGSKRKLRGKDRQSTFHCPATRFSSLGVIWRAVQLFMVQVPMPWDR